LRSSAYALPLHNALPLLPGTRSGARAMSALVPHHASSTPTDAPIAERKRLSLSSCLMRRAREAPSATRARLIRQLLSESLLLSEIGRADVLTPVTSLPRI